MACGCGPHEQTRHSKQVVQDICACKAADVQPVLTLMLCSHLLDDRCCIYSIMRVGYFISYWLYAPINMVAQPCSIAQMKDAI
eukprot:scaffold10884_cov135-Isochrysis_galbana.AAC.1